MKKKLSLAILGMTAVSSFGQGVIKLDNYNTSGPYVTYGAGTDGGLGVGLGASYTMGLYYWNALGDFTGSTSIDPTGFADPATLGDYLLGTGPGSTAQFETSAFGTRGAACAASAWEVPIAPSPTGGATITIMIVAYEGSSYASAPYRAHSAPFTLVTSDSSSTSAVAIGTAMPGWGIYPVPEPSTLALAGLIGGAWLFFHRHRS